MSNDIGDNLALTMFAGMVLLTIAVLGYRGCGKETEKDMRQRDGVVQIRIECLKAGHTPLECKEL